MSYPNEAYNRAFEARLLVAIKEGQDTFGQLTSLPDIKPWYLDDTKYKMVDRALRRMKSRGIITFNRKRGCWEATGDA